MTMIAEKETDTIDVQSRKHTISLLVENKFGAFNRIAGLFSAKGYNIDSLTVGPTEDDSVSRMTIVTRGDDNIIEQITKQLNKLIDTLKGPHSQEYYQAINSLAALRCTNALPALREIAFDRADKDNRDRWMATRALGIIGDKESVPEMIHLLYHLNANTRWWAQISLVRLTGTNEKEGREILGKAGMVSVETMDEGAARAVALAQGAK